MIGNKIKQIKDGLKANFKEWKDSRAEEKKAFMKAEKLGRIKEAEKLGRVSGQQKAQKRFSKTQLPTLQKKQTPTADRLFGADGNTADKLFGKADENYTKRMFGK